MIDAHVHIWHLGRNDCTWPTADLAAIHRDHELVEIERLAAPLGATAMILVQSQESDRDTDWLLGQAAASPFVTGVVGWVDLATTDIGARLDALIAAGPLVGIRPMMQDLPADAYDDPALAAGLTALADRDLTLDALIRPGHLPALGRLADRHPRLRIVIDHAAKPEIGAGGHDRWHEAIAPLARHPLIACKLSGLLTETAPDQPPEAVLDYIRAVHALFSGDRLIWGSDWPVINLRGDYAAWLALARGAIPTSEHDAVFGRNARAFYPRTRT